MSSGGALRDDRRMPDRDPSTPPFDFTRATPASVAAGAEAAIAASEAMLAALVAAPAGARTFANTVVALDVVRDRMQVAGGEFGFLSNVAPDDGLRHAAREVQRRLRLASTAIGFREDVYAALRAYGDTPEARALQGVDARLLERTLRDYRRNGLDLDAASRARVRALRERLVALGVDFARNIDEYDDALLLARDELEGLPESYVARLEQVATAAGTRYRVSLDYPEFTPFMEAAEREPLRRALFLKGHNQAVEANLPLLQEAIAARDEIAALLGYPSWAHYQIEIKMARTPQAVLAFLDDLERRVRVKAAVDVEVLTAAKRAHTGDPDTRLEIWDWRFYQQRVLREQHGVDAFEVAAYFPLDAALAGMFAVYERLVGVRFVRIEEARAWHADVRLYRVEDAGDGHHIGHMYLDLHPRADKYGHAAAFTVRGGRRREDGTYDAPVAAMVANFTKPTAQEPSLLRHAEVEVLFHEFGHILHEVLTRAPYSRFAGAGVERDFVEAPSQMLEHWCWEPRVLAGFARHVETGAPLPEDLLARMVAARHVGSGLHHARQIYFARLDLAYHLEGRTKDTDAIAQALHAITGFAFPLETHLQAGFGHLFGYDAGYYGYLWSQVYGDDMFTRFEAALGSDEALATVGADYRRVILEAGGTRDGADLLREFLGRDPTPAAFLRAIGLEA